MGRIRLHVALDCSAYSLETFILDNVEPGSIIATDSWKSYNFIEDVDCAHEKSNQSSSQVRENLYGVHLVTSLIKRLIRGTFHGRFEPKYLQNYLDEYTFRFNRRKSKNIGKKFMRIVQQAVKSAKVTYSELLWDMDPISEHFTT
jgi:hypothetical protein